MLIFTIFYSNIILIKLPGRLSENVFLVSIFLLHILVYVILQFLYKMLYFCLFDALLFVFQNCSFNFFYLIYYVICFSFLMLFYVIILMTKWKNFIFTHMYFMSLIHSNEKLKLRLLIELEPEALKWQIYVEL